MNKRLINLLLRALKSKKLSIPLILTLFAFFASSYSNINIPYIKDFLKPKQELYAKVIKISDGDTIQAIDINKNTYKIRLQGIDAPENKQEYGKEAKSFLSAMIKDKEVKLIIEDKDKYGRYLATIYLNQMNVNRQMVANGYAHAYKEYSKEYIQDENNAKKKRLGLWQSDNVISPSEFRKR